MQEGKQNESLKVVNGLLSPGPLRPSGPSCFSPATSAQEEGQLQEETSKLAGRQEEGKLQEQASKLAASS